MPELQDPYLLIPFELPVDANVVIPGSKSITNRALMCAALASGITELHGVLQADDTEAMQECIVALGATCERGNDDGTILVVTGVGGSWSSGPVTVDARMSGTTARFIAPSLLLGAGTYVLDGRESMRERPMGDLVAALQSAGARVESRDGGRLPITVDVGLPDSLQLRVLTVPGNVSSQFLSGLLLTAPCLPGGAVVRVEGELVSRPYVDMTIAVMRQFGAVVSEVSAGVFEVRPTGYTSAGIFAVEPDASAASYAFAAAAITGGRVFVPALGVGSTQGDLRFTAILAEMGATVSITNSGTEVSAELGSLHGVTVDMSDCSDVAQTLAVVAVHAAGPTTVTGIGFIRFKETNRVAAVVAELQRCGIDATEHEDGFVINPGPVRPAVVQTYRDHRMAMSFALLGLRSPGVSIADPGCVAKTFPDYFAVLESWRRNTSGESVC
jgi:3-phosphoshikimate 1-carboxyvinyltransferase